MINFLLTYHSWLYQKMEYHGGKLTRSLCLSAHATEWLRHKRCHLELWEMFDLSACLESTRDSGKLNPVKKDTKATARGHIINKMSLVSGARLLRCHKTHRSVFSALLFALFRFDTKLTQLRLSCASSFAAKLDMPQEIEST